MDYTNLGLAEALMKTRIEDAQRQLELNGLLRQAGLEPRGRLSGQGRWMLRQLGHRLVVLGELLERHGLPQSCG